LRPDGRDGKAGTERSKNVRAAKPPACCAFPEVTGKYISKNLRTAPTSGVATMSHCAPWSAGAAAVRLLELSLLHVYHGGGLRAASEKLFFSTSRKREKMNLFHFK
jgi:hypothetical protein